MPLRGPYKQYEVNTSIAVPKSTSHDRRKWRMVEVIDPVNNIEEFKENIRPEYLDNLDVQVKV